MKTSSMFTDFSHIIFFFSKKHCKLVWRIDFNISEDKLVSNLSQNHFQVSTPSCPNAWILPYWVVFITIKVDSAELKSEVLLGTAPINYKLVIPNLQVWVCACVRVYQIFHPADFLKHSILPLFPARCKCIFLIWGEGEVTENAIQTLRAAPTWRYKLSSATKVSQSSHYYKLSPLTSALPCLSDYGKHLQDTEPHFPPSQEFQVTPVGLCGSLQKLSK